MKIKKGDTVQIVSGKEKGKTGKVMKVDGAAGMVLLDGLNLFKKHRRPKKQGEKGEIVSVPRPLNAAKVMFMCSSCGNPARIGYRVEEATKIRFCKKCKAVI